MKKEKSLTVTRRPDEYLDFIVTPSETPTTLSIRVAGITGNQVRINCKAPRSVSILRRELVRIR